MLRTAHSGSRALFGEGLSVLLLDTDETVSEASKDDDDDARAVENRDGVAKIHCTECHKEDLQEWEGQ